MDEDYTILVDEVSTTVTYVGKAVRGSITSAAVWQIMKILESGTITSVKWADGRNSFTKIWDNRAGYTYS